MVFQNVVVGEPVCKPWLMFGYNEVDWEENEKTYTLFTNERFLPKILVEAGLVKSISEVRRNKPELVRTLDKVDFLEVKWGKRKLFIQVGE